MVNTEIEVCLVGSDSDLICFMNDNNDETNDVDNKDTGDVDDGSVGGHFPVLLQKLLVLQRVA